MSMSSIPHVSAAPGEEICGICHNSLLQPTGTDPTKYTRLIDDVELICKHHFHMSCQMDWAASSATPLDKCAMCRTQILDRIGRFLVKVRSEGGYRGAINIEDDMDRAFYMKIDQDMDRAQAFLNLMSHEKYEHAEKFLMGEDEGGAGNKLSPDVTFIGDTMTALHLAALNDDEVAAKLLLKYGADKSLRTGDSLSTALEIAMGYKNDKVAALLWKK